MPALQGIAPLLEPSALWGIAQQLWAARDRLALRTGATIPSASQLLVALRMYITDRDHRRGALLPSPTPLPTPPPAALPAPPPQTLVTEAAAAASATAGISGALGEVGQCLMLAQAAYADGKDELLAILARVAEGDEFLLEARWYSSHCHPAYFIAYDARLKAVVLSVRGSKEVSDFITNLSCDTAPFFGGYGHSGVVGSAQNLAQVIQANIYRYIDVYKPENGLVVVGHSLGGAVATLVAMMLRTNTLHEHAHLASPPPRRVSSSRASVSTSVEESHIVRASDLRAADALEAEHRAAEKASAPPAATSYALSIAQTVRCFVFSSPPCLSPKVALLARNLGVKTFVLGLDMVPRLSAGSLDRLLLAVSRYDWQSELTGNVEDNVRGFLSSALGPASGAAAATVIATVGPSLIGPVVGAIQRSAQSALMAPREPGRSSTPVMHPVSKLMLGAVAVGAGFLSNQFFFSQGQEQRRVEDGSGSGHERQLGDYSFAARFGLSPEQVEEALIPNRPEILHLAGRVLHIDRPFTPPDAFRNDETLPPAQLVERGPEFFLDVEASAWMLHDHHPQSFAIALASIEEQSVLY